MRGRDHAADLAGTLYETVLLAILKGLRSAFQDDPLMSLYCLVSCSRANHYHCT